MIPAAYTSLVAWANKVQWLLERIAQNSGADFSSAERAAFTVTETAPSNTSGTIAAGKALVSFTAVGGAATVGGISLPENATKVYEVQGHTTPAIAWSCTSGVTLLTTVFEYPS